MKRMLDQMGFQQAASGWDLPPPGSNRGYPPVQLIEQWVVSIWCGACRFAPAETVRFDGTLTRLFGLDEGGGASGDCAAVRAVRHGPQRGGPGGG